MVRRRDCAAQDLHRLGQTRAILPELVLEDSSSTHASPKRPPLSPKASLRYSDSPREHYS
eukprot:scaffold65103_cov31-Tisochrysis_lutea.AAC.2